MNNLDKNKIVEKILAQLEKDAIFLEKKFKEEIKIAIEAPGRMQSRYEKEKEEFSRNADRTADRYKLTAEMIEYFKQLDFGISQSVREGSLIVLEDQNSKKNEYFFLSRYGALEVEDEDVNILTISVSSPLGEKVKGKKKDETFILKTPLAEKNFKVIEVF